MGLIFKIIFRIPKKYKLKEKAFNIIWLFCTYKQIGYKIIREKITEIKIF